MKQILICIALILTGCESKAGSGALIGGGIGTGVGALISPTPAGALIGAGVGAAVGAGIGASLDSEDQQTLQKRSAPTANRVDRGEQLSLSDIEHMTAAGITDDKIIGTIHSTGSIYNLSSADVNALEKAGVSRKVIDYMLQTAYQ